MNNKTRKIVMSALIASLTCVATMVIKIPSHNGYINLGDSIVLIAGWMLSASYGFLAAGLGSALADLLAGYITYAPATFIIKGLMAIIALYGFKLINKKLGNLSSRILSGVLAELIMITGYFVFDGCLYGFIPTIATIPANCVQGAAGLIVGVILIEIFEKSKISLD